MKNAKYLLIIICSSFLPLYGMNGHSSVFSYPSPILSGKALADSYNQKYLGGKPTEEGYQFYFDESGLFTFGLPNDGNKAAQRSHAVTNRARKDRIKELGLDPAYGDMGIDPFRMYTRSEFRKTVAYAYMHSLGRIEIFNADLIIGSSVINLFINNYGPEINKEIKDWENKWAERKQWINDFIPTVLTLFKMPFIWLLLPAVVLVFIVFPIISSKLATYLFTALFKRRPVILKPEDSDLYNRFSFRSTEALPPVIVNPALEIKLAQLSQNNRAITQRNKGGWFTEPIKTPYEHILAFGPPGVGKTLFAKTLAKESGMHFIYLSLADLSQLTEEEALSTLKEYFIYAKRHAPVLLIIDESHLLFDKTNLKAQLLLQMFQKEFAKAVNEAIQLFFIANYPESFLESDGSISPMLSRLGERLFFDEPDAKTRKRLLYIHLELAKSHYPDANFETERIMSLLASDDLYGFNGRSIERLAHRFCRGKHHLGLVFAR